MSAKVFPLFLIVALLAACGSSSPPTSTASAPVPGPVVPVGEPEVRDLGPTTETVWNCGSGGGTVVKHPAMSVVTNYAVEWEVGGTSGVGVRIGDGVIPGGLDLSATLEGHYTTGFEQGVQQGTGWDLPAEPNTIMVYTLMWREVWQPGYVDVRLADQSVVRVNVRYRTGVQSEIVGKQQRTCGEEQQVPTQQIPSQPTSTAIQSATQAPQGGIVSLDYDETGGVRFAQGQTQFVAVYLQRVQAGGSLEEAIQSIKQQAANARATVQEGNSISIQSLQAYLVWCPNVDCIYPANTAFPLEGFRQDYLKVAVIEVGGSRVVQCPSYCWAVAVR